LPPDLDGVHRFTEPLQLQLPQRRELVTPPASGQQADQVGGQDLPALGSGAQATGLDDRGAEAVPVLHDHVSGRQADSHDEGQFRMVPGVGLGRLLDRHRRGHRVAGTGKAGQDTVAEPFHHPATVSLYGGAQQPVVVAAESLGRVLTDPRPQLRRRHQVGHQNRGGLRDGHVIDGPAMVRCSTMPGWGQSEIAFGANDDTGIP
jgi:hypothetical protein